MQAARIARPAPTGARPASVLRAPAPSASRRLPIGRTGDAAEREADTMAAAALRGQAIAAPGAAGPPGLRRKCAACEQEEESLSRKEAGGGAAPGFAPPLVHSVLGPPRVPLGGAERAFFEPRFGRDFSHVRLHADAEAAASAHTVNARAYTVGHHVVLGAGETDPGLLAHELAHVVQNGAEPTGPLRRQRKTVGGPLDLELDPCISALDHDLCVHHLQSACEFDRDLPGCGFICKTFGCKKQEKPSHACPPGWRTATAGEFAGQCCQGGIDSAQACCPPERVALVDKRCCAPGQLVIDGHCVNSSDLPPLPGQDCPPAQRNLLGQCCTPPLVPQGVMCGPPGPPPGPGPGPIGPAPQFGTLWTDRIHFERDQPGGGGGAVLTPDGAKELDSVLSWLRLSPDLEVRLIGRASFEGPEGSREDYNDALAARRVKFVVDAMKGFSTRIAEPVIGDSAASGCRPVAPGEWSCGSKDAPAGSARPEDRTVDVTFARNKLTLPEMKLERPSASGRF